MTHSLCIHVGYYTDWFQLGLCSVGASVSHFGCIMHYDSSHWSVIIFGSSVPSYPHWFDIETQRERTQLRIQAGVRPIMPR